MDKNNKTEKYQPSLIEKKWQKKWEEKKIYSPDLDLPAGKVKPFYNLMMFPYPSAEGMHVGNMYAFTGSDIYGRFKRMQGHETFEPIGLDGFGIHSENYAIKVGRHPKEQAKISEENFYRQLRSTGNAYDWTRTVETYDPDYYKWTQWIFIQLFKKGLAYRKKAPVNFCPSCKTVLADEQVIEGACERCGTMVEKKDLEQWFFKITDYADRLLEGLKSIDWSEKVKIAQKNWIGRSESTEIDFPIKGLDKKIKIVTTRPDTIFGATFVTLSPEHPLINELKEEIKNYQDVVNYVKNASGKTDFERGLLGREKTGVKLEGVVVVNPLNNKEIPVYISDFVLVSYGTGAIMSVPAHDDRDFEFAKNFNLPIVQVVESSSKGPIAIQIYDEDLSSEADEIRKIAKEKEYATPTVRIYELSESEITELVDILKKAGVGSEGDYQRIKKGEEFTLEINPRSISFLKAFEGDGKHINSEFLNGLNNKEAILKINSFITEKKIGKQTVNYHLRDWLISRQRYWGPPIPMIFCENCASEKLGYLEVGSGKLDFENLKSGNQDIKNSKNQDQEYPISNFKNSMHGWFPVPEDKLPVLLPDVKDWKPLGTGVSPLANHPEFYETTCPNCGGKARRETDVSDTFLDSAWYFFRYISTDFKDKAFDQKRVENWLPVDMYIGGAEHSVLHLLYTRFLTMFFKDLGLIQFEEPFKKFRAHGLIIAEGAKMSKSKGNVVNPDKYIKEYGADTLRMYLMFMGPFEYGGDFRDAAIGGIYRFLTRVWQLQGLIANKEETEEEKVMVNKAIQKVTNDIEGLHFNTAIASLMTLLNFFSRQGSVSKESFEKFLILLAPFAPHITEELWQVVRSFEVGSEKLDLENLKSGNQDIKNSKNQDQKNPISNFKNSKFSSVHCQSWPLSDKKYLQEEEVLIVVQVNGKVRDSIKYKVEGIKDKDEVEKNARESEKVKKYLEGKEIKKVVYVEGKIINFVTEEN